MGYSSTVYCKVMNDEVREFKKLELANCKSCEEQSKPDDFYTYYIIEDIRFCDRFSDVVEMQDFFDNSELSGMTCIGEDGAEHNRLGHTEDIVVYTEMAW
jgi:hypothetical protein